MKDILGISDGKADLKTLMAIEITNYTLKDTLSKGSAPHKKVVGQQVKAIYPQAVSSNITEVVPDIYCGAHLKDGWIMLATDLAAGEKVKIITENAQEIYEVIEAEPNRFKVALPTPDSGSQKVFVYGREVDDFHTVDYEAIAMLNVSDTQEQQRIIEAKQAEIEGLKAENSRLKAQSSVFEKRIVRIETALQKMNVNNSYFD